MFPPWHPFVYMFLTILAIYIFRLILHILIILLSNRRNRNLKLRVAEDYDFIEGWKAEPENNNGDSDNGNKGDVE